MIPDLDSQALCTRMDAARRWLTREVTACYTIYLMPNEPSYSPFAKSPTARISRVEPLFDFVRGSDRAPMSCELRFHGESFGWEALLFERGELFASHGGFVTRALAVQWAVEERRFLETTGV
jgi:hypothetical protein